MDNQVANFQHTIKQLLLQYAERAPSEGNIETRPVFDEERDTYILLGVGWDLTGRVYSVLLDLTIKNDKIWVEVDGTEEGITQDLLDAGIPKDNIVLGFYRPHRRSLTDFAVV